jgi:hypothetical protein
MDAVSSMQQRTSVVQDYAFTRKTIFLSESIMRKSFLPLSLYDVSDTFCDCTDICMFFAVHIFSVTKHCQLLVYASNNNHVQSCLMRKCKNQGSIQGTVYSNAIKTASYYSYLHP